MYRFCEHLQMVQKITIPPIPICDNSSVAVVVQIYLQMNRLDLAKKEVESCKAWAEDAMLAQLMEAWVGLRVGGGDRYQNAYYIYEEIATSSTSPTIKSMVGEAVCNIQMGQYPEAEGILQEALAKEPTNTDAIVNQIVLSTLLSKPAEEINALVQ
jgi:coatomer protein complex subunit epsilon